MIQNKLPSVPFKLIVLVSIVTGFDLPLEFNEYTSSMSDSLEGNEQTVNTGVVCEETFARNLSESVPKTSSWKTCFRPPSCPPSHSKIMHFAVLFVTTQLFGSSGGPGIKQYRNLVNHKILRYLH